MSQKLMILCLGLILVVSSCKNENEKKVDGFLINATIDNSNGKLAQLIRIENRAQIIIDSALVQEGKLSLKGKVNSPDMYYLTIEGNSNTLPFIVENTEMSIELNVDSLFASNINGSKENDVFKKYQDQQIPLRTENFRLSDMYRTAQVKNDSIGMKQARKIYDSLVIVGNTIDKNFVIKNTNSVAAALVLEKMYKSKIIGAKEGFELYENFTDYVKNSRPSVDLKVLFDANLATAIGSIAPDFSAPTPDGNTITLSEIKGKVTIIDFWAAWCGPCRRENPNIVKVYNKYHDKGLEIIGVSLDGDRRQQNPKDAWLKAIEKDKLSWYHVSNLSYFNGPVAKQYNISSIPAMFILDQDGKIIDKNLRGSALEEKMAELFD